MAEALTREAILASAEDVLRRYGPAKTSVVDIARALGVSHGTVYRHFESKAAIRDAVTERWLDRVSAPLEDVIRAPRPAIDRLHEWLVVLTETKQQMAVTDPEMFETLLALTMTSREVVAAHVDHLAEQLSRIIADGIADGEFAPGDPAVLGRAVLQATARFHHPLHAAEWDDPGLAADFDAVYALVLRGLIA
ncbi:TetR family transcriptional regulator [Agromyces sp. Soil535]|uniref:TetR family transcriptional regulator n=1 Tax=Agromyces sp. Soil535 TaxID=1736390 RepID=UPI0006F47E56|nr:TetR family transcriptional regulator [Agromyces sp. Soil535]KRE31156.1 TetR family transcriptional regulator [Agromyces sp. Soil535]